MPQKIPFFRIKKIAVLRALQLGDVLCALPAFQSLRSFFPDARIAYIGLPWAKAFVHRFSHLIDEFIEFPGYPGLPEREVEIATVPAFLRDMQNREFDLAIQLHGSGPFVNSLIKLFGARNCAGFFLPGDYCPDPRLFTPFPNSGHEIQRLLKLFDFLEIPSTERYAIPVTEQDRRDLRNIPEAADLDKTPYACLHPGARFRSRRWMPERFAHVADAIASWGMNVVLTGSADEEALSAAVQSAMKSPAINLAGKTTFGALAAVVREAKLVVSNDTGVSHVAAGLGTPSVVIVGGSDPERWAPLDKTLHHVVAEPVDCRPCYHDECPIGFKCAEAITADRVIEEAERVLRGMPCAA